MNAENCFDKLKYHSKHPPSEFTLILWHGNGLAIHRLRVPVLAGHHCVVALDKLLTPVCLCHQAV